MTRIEGQELCIYRVTNELSKNECVHLACRGLLNGRQPFKAAFALHDGCLTIQRINSRELKDPEFACLSACHGTVETGSANEMDPASTMQFTGFRSVVGTIWVAGSIDV